MFCCLDYGNNNADFPGNRRGYTRTGGNALQATAAKDFPMIANETVSVTVPPNKYGGDQILVSAPSGKCISAIIPQGMVCGDEFQVDIPNDPFNTDERNQAHFPPQTQQHSQAVTPIEMPPPTAPLMEGHFSKTPIASAVLETRQDNSAFANSFRPVPPPPQGVDPNKKLVLVKVPPGCAPGSTIHVQIPGENRMVAAEVPPNVDEFHVSYEPKPQRTQQNQIPKVTGQSVPTTWHNNNMHNTYNHSQNNSVFHQPQQNSGNGLYTDTRRNEQRYQTRSQNSYHSNQHSNYHHTKENQSDGGMGILAPLLGGAAMMAGAGYMIGHHDNGGGGDQD